MAVAKHNTCEEPPQVEWRSFVNTCRNWVELSMIDRLDSGVAAAVAPAPIGIVSRENATKRRALPVPGNIRNWLWRKT